MGIAHFPCRRHIITLERTACLDWSASSLVSDRLGNALADGVEGGAHAGDEGGGHGGGGHDDRADPRNVKREEVAGFFQDEDFQDVPFERDADQNADDGAKDAHERCLGEDGTDDLKSGGADGTEQAHLAAALQNRDQQGRYHSQGGDKHDHELLGIGDAVKPFDYVVDVALHFFTGQDEESVGFAEDILDTLPHFDNVGPGPHEDVKLVHGIVVPVRDEVGPVDDQAAVIPRVIDDIADHGERHLAAPAGQGKNVARPGAVKGGKVLRNDDRVVLFAELLVQRQVCRATATSLISGMKAACVHGVDADLGSSFSLAKSDLAHAER